jgi:hypothetical protein
VGFDIFLIAMDKAVKRHILRKRVILAKRSDEPMTFTQRAPKFLKWFEEDVLGFDSEEYRREFWREAYRNGRTIGHVPHTLSDHLRRRGRRSEAMLLDALCISLLMGGGFAIWVIRRRIDLHLHHLRRPSYYETERARRLGLTEERRRIRRRTTVNPRPTAEQLRDAFIHARESVGNMVRLGSLMEDLECYIDNSLVFGEDGKIIARKGGIRRYIQSEIPDLYKSYKTLMRYKALARRFRQAVGICDPVPASSVLPDEDGNADVGIDTGAFVPKCQKVPENTDNKDDEVNNKGTKCIENMVRTNSQGGVVRVLDGGGSGESILDYDDVNGETTGGGEGVSNRECIDESMTTYKDASGSSGCGSGERVYLNDEIRRVVREILDVCEGTFLDLSAVLALRICEDTIPHRFYHCARK